MLKGKKMVMNFKRGLEPKVAMATGLCADVEDWLKKKGYSYDPSKVSIEYWEDTIVKTIEYSLEVNISIIFKYPRESKLS